MAIRYALACWADLTGSGKQRVYRYLTLKGHSGSSMRTMIKWDRPDSYDRNPMVIARDGDKIVGWSIESNDGEVWAFVMAKYRRKGIGRPLVKMVAKETSGKSIHVCNHDDLSRAFWTALGCPDSPIYGGEIGKEKLT